MSVYDSLKTYHELELSSGLKVRVKKMKLGEFLEFGALIRHASMYKVMKSEKLELDCLTLACGIACAEQGEGTDADVRAIIDTAKELNGLNKKSDRSTPVENESPVDGKRDDKWLQKLLARLMRDLKISKHAALEMYPSEIAAILEENRRLARIEKLELALNISTAKYAPDRIADELKELSGTEETKVKVSPEEEKKLQEKYGNPEYGVRLDMRSAHSATAPIGEK